MEYPPTPRPPCPVCGGALQGRQGYCSPTCRHRAKGWRNRARDRDFIRAWKTSHGCAVCGLMGPPYVLEFHHVDPATKSFEIGDFRKDGRPKLERELAKCIVLCSVHHRMVEAGDLDPPAL